MTELVQAGLEASCTTNWWLLSSLDVVDIVEVEDGERVPGSLLVWRGRRGGRGQLVVLKERGGRAREL